ncbi:MAG TPA: hypothetical protein VND64_32260 [Pirellulales bacterium]|nr:hypothetical protein [Pirellulales bacterium]
MAIVRRDLADARAQVISDDWRFGIAYNAALKLCTALLCAEGFRPERELAHFRALQALPIILGPDRQPDADYLESCRRKRNRVEYESVGGATGENADELIEFVQSLQKDVLNWLRGNHPNLAPPKDSAKP